MSLVLLLCLTALTAQAAKPEPLTYKSAGRRYVIALPDVQLWSQSEIARSVQWHEAGKLFIDGKEIRQARLRGQAGDRTNRNYLVTVMRSGKRISPSPRYFVRPDPWTHLPAPPMPVSAGKTGKASHFPTFSSAPLRSAPLTLTLAWDDVAGAIPAGWGATDLIMMPDGGPKFWTVHASRDLVRWRTVAVTTTNRVTIGTPWPGEFYTVHWRGQGTPAEVWP